MLTIIRLNQFKKDIKKLSHSGSKDMTKLKEVIIKLVNEEKLDSKYRNHRLSGNWKDHLECHIEPDWLLIYRIDEKSKELILVRSGSHSELF